MRASSNDDAFFRVRAYNAAGDTAYTNEAGAPRHSYATITPNTYNEPANVRLSSTASDPDGITRVEQGRQKPDEAFAQSVKDAARAAR